MVSITLTHNLSPLYMGNINLSLVCRNRDVCFCVVADTIEIILETNSMIKVHWDMILVGHVIKSCEAQSHKKPTSNQFFKKHRTING